MKAIFPLGISYSQVAVFHGGLENPFNNWSDQHLAQGFSWRPESVSFKTLIETGQTSVEVRTAEKMPVPKGVMAIAVPFIGPKTGEVEIASITDGRTFEIRPGKYRLLFETGNTEQGNWCRLTFVRNGSQTPRILRSDSDKIPSSSLLMHAEPA